jgi:hypothetical protein
VELSKPPFQLRFNRHVTVPVLSGEKITGAVRLTYPVSEVTARVSSQMTVLWTVAGTTVLLAGLLAYLMAAAITRIEIIGDSLELPGEGLTLIAYTAEPGSHAQEQLNFLAIWNTTQPDGTASITHRSDQTT